MTSKDESGIFLYRKTIGEVTLRKGKGMNLINYSRSYIAGILKRSALSERSRQGLGFIRSFKVGQERENGIFADDYL